MTDEFFSVYFTTDFSTSRAVTNGISMPLLTGLICDRLIDLIVLIYLKPEAPMSMKCMYVCMYLLIGKGQSAQKDHIGAKIE